MKASKTQVHSLVRPAKHGHAGSNVESTWSSLPGYYGYQFKQGEWHVFHEEFEGNIFGTSVQELNLDFNLNVGSTTFDIRKIPQRIYIAGIGDSNIVTVYPEPTERYPLGLGYVYTPGLGRESPNNIKLTAIDRSMIYKTQFRIFALGMIAGIFASIVATILTEVVGYIEMKGKPNPQGLD